MKFKHILILAAAAAMVVPAMARKSKESGQPLVQFETTTHDFGTISETGGVVSCDFEFKNVGNGNLVILGATAECGCTRPSYPEKPVAPGKKGVIKVTYNPARRPGNFTKVVTVRTNGKVQKHRLKITGTVTPKKAAQ